MIALYNFCSHIADFDASLNERVLLTSNKRLLLRCMEVDTGKKSTAGYSANKVKPRIAHRPSSMWEKFNKLYHYCVTTKLQTEIRIFIRLSQEVKKKVYNYWRFQNILNCIGVRQDMIKPPSGQRQIKDKTRNLLANQLDLLCWKVYGALYPSETFMPYQQMRSLLWQSKPTLHRVYFYRDIMGCCRRRILWWTSADRVRAS